MPIFEIEFYSSSDLINKKGSSSFHCTSKEIDMFGEIYGENLIYHLDRHYEAYRVKEAVRKNHPDWKLAVRGSFQGIGGIGSLLYKTRATSISGNVGEGLIIPALKSISKRNVIYHRLTSKSKCPDFLVELDNRIFNKWGISSYPSNTVNMPIEVKSKFGNDNKFPLQALSQLISYWEIMNNAGFNNEVGKGIIARVNLLENSGIIKLFLFAPKDASSAVKIKQILTTNKNNATTSILNARLGDLFL